MSDAHEPMAIACCADAKYAVLVATLLKSIESSQADAGRRIDFYLVDNGIAHEIGDKALFLGPNGVGTEAEDEQLPVTVRRLAGQAVLEAAAGSDVTLNGDPCDGR